MLDAAEPGWGASGRNGGQIIPGLKHDPDELERIDSAAETGPPDVGRPRAPPPISSSVSSPGTRSRATPSGAGGSRRPRTRPRSRACGRGRSSGSGAAPSQLLDAKPDRGLTGTTGYAGGMLDRRAGALQPLAFVRRAGSGAAQQAGAVIHGGSLYAGSGVRPAAGGWTTQAGA